MRNRDYPIAPAVLGLVLGDKLEQALRQSLIISDGDLSILVTHPIGTSFLALAFLSLAAPFIFSSFPLVRQLRQQVILGDRDGVLD